jgi:hypothetical protein
VVEFELFEVVVVEQESGCGRNRVFLGGCGIARVWWCQIRAFCGG